MQHFLGIPNFKLMQYGNYNRVFKLSKGEFEMMKCSKYCNQMKSLFRLIAIDTINNIFDKL